MNICRGNRVRILFPQPGPPTALVTQTCTVHKAPALILPPETSIEFAPLTGGQGDNDPQFEIVALELLTVTPVGRVSVNEKLVSAVSSGALKVKIRSEFPPLFIVAGEKVFVAVIPAPLVYTELGR